MSIAFNLQLSSYFATKVNLEIYSSALSSYHEEEAIRHRSFFQKISDFFGITNYEEAIATLFAIVKSPDSTCFQKNIHKLAAIVVPEERESFNKALQFEIRQEGGNSIVQIHLSDSFIAEVEFEGHLVLSDKYFQPVQVSGERADSNKSYFQINTKFQQLIDIAVDANAFYENNSSAKQILEENLKIAKNPITPNDISSVWADLPRTLAFLPSATPGEKSLDTNVSGPSAEIIHEEEVPAASEPLESPGDLISPGTADFPLKSEDGNDVITQEKFKEYIFKHVRHSTNDPEPSTLVNEELGFTCGEEEWPKIFERLPMATQVFLIVAVSQGLKALGAFSELFIFSSAHNELILPQKKTIYNYNYIHKVTESGDHECKLNVVIDARFTDDLACKDIKSNSPIKAHSLTSFDYSFSIPKDKGITSAKIELNNLNFEVVALPDEEQAMRHQSCKNISNARFVEKKSMAVLSAPISLDYSFPSDIFC